MDRKVFYDAVRKDVFGGKLSQSQVDGIELLLAEADRRGLNNEFTGSILGTAFWETAHTMEPVTEYGSRKYLTGKRYWPYIGRGYVQLTWEYNYEKATRYFQDVLGIDVDFVKNPDLAKKPEYAVIILFEGVLEGWFTGKKLSDYLDGVAESFEEDLREQANGRRVVNGTDKQVKIGKIKLKFVHALRAAGRPETGNADAPVVTTPEAPEARPEAPVSRPEVPETNSADTPKQTVLGRFLVAIFRAFIEALRGIK